MTKPNSSELTFNRQKLIRIFFFVTFALVFYQLFLLARPFLTALLLAGMLAMAFYPVYLRLKLVVKNRNLASLLLTFGVFLAAAVPLVGGTWFLFKESERLLPTVQNFLANLQQTDLIIYREKFPMFLQPSVERLLNFFQTIEVQPQGKIIQFAAFLGTKITSIGTDIARNAFLFLINAVVLLISLFFAFRDGEKLVAWGLSLIPMDDADKRAIAHRAYETFMAVVMGVVVTAGAQGLAATIGYWVAGVRLPLLLGLATCITSFFGASFLVTFPVALSFFKESVGWGIFLLIWGLGVVGFLDNILKPILIGSRARMPFVLIFFSIIGGVKAYGILGFILGPILVASFLTFVDIYRKIYQTRSSEED